MSDGDPECDADKRREAFIADIVEVCKKHRVMIDMDDDDPESFSFEEHDPSSSFCFLVDIFDLERSIREKVWPVVYGNK